MALTHTDLMEIDLGRLDSAVSGWKKAVDDLNALAEDARQGMRAKSDAARWAGVNATVTRGFVTKTTKEIADLHTEAGSIHQVLDDAHTELVSLQKQVRTAVQVDAVKLGIRVEDVGGGKVRCYFAHVRGDSDERTQEQLDAREELEGRINQLLAHASEIDASVARALRKSHGDDRHNAGHSSYASLDEAQSERAAELAKLGTELTDQQFMELNSIMRFNARDADFSTAFYKSLGGPMETLEFYGKMSLDGTAGDDKARLALTRQLQQNMGTALASATDPDNKPHLPAGWGDEFRRLGTQHIPVDPTFRSNPYGYQVLGGILRYGDYDARFINPIAGHIVQLHHEDPSRFMYAKPAAGGADLDWGYNPSGQTGAGYDPLTSVLQGLGHSPDAAKQFFSDETTPVVYREDGTVDETATLGYNYFNELTDKDFEWPADSLVHPGSDEADHARDAGPDALGHALEAAATGSSWDADPPTLHRDEQTHDIMQQVMDRYNVTRADGPPDPLKDSLARMGAAYIDDLNYSIMNYGDSGDQLDRDGLFAHSSDGSPREAFDGFLARNFMMQVAGEEDGYRTLTAAQQLYMASGLAAGETDQENAIPFVENAAKVHGILDESRSQGIREEFKSAEDAANLALSKDGEWRKTLMTVGVTAVATGGAAMVLGPAAGVVTATAVPLVMQSGGSAITTVYGNHTLQYMEDHAYNNDPEALMAVQTLEQAGERATAQPFLRYAQTVGMSLPEQRDIVNEIETNYRNGKAIISDNEKVAQ
ncbi:MULTISPECIES: hypothetical protein [Streptomyces]|uniref:AG2 protein n=1 Tax=Streptomyces lienomycini TaxID=284035 RepID=A0ABV9WUY9_9ACTN|nr:hypothetical protein [Streptomyces lienomycini]